MRAPVRCPFCRAPVPPWDGLDRRLPHFPCCLRLGLIRRGPEGAVAGVVLVPRRLAALGSLLLRADGSSVLRLPASRREHLPPGSFLRAFLHLRRHALVSEVMDA